MIIHHRYFERLLFAQFMDVATLAIFIFGIGASIHSERNPLVIGLLAIGGVWAVLLVKVGVPVIVTLRYKGREWKPVTYKIVIVVMAAVTASGIVGAGFNIASIINSLTGFSIHV